MATFLMDAIAVYLAFFKQLLPLVAICIFLCNLDELVIDGLYLRLRLSEWLGRGHRQRLTAEDLVTPDAGWIAIFVPALREANVIGHMLRRALRTLDYPRYRILVGTYPDDPATQAAVRAVAAEDDRVICIVGDKPSKGSSKGANLNVLYDAMLALERAGHPPFKAVALHDAEDVVHRMELHVFNRFVPEKALVQLPVVPLAHTGIRWWGHTYLDEFAEAHARDMVVRDRVGASLPSAGVGCAFSRPALAAAARENGGRPFRPQAKTEDYELGISLGLKGFPAAMVRIRASRSDPRCVATRGYFPNRFRDAVLQRSRWLLGITLASWRRFGWSGRLVDRYMLLRDRKALPCAFLNALALGLLIQLSLLWLCARMFGWQGYALLVEPGGLTERLLAINLGILGWRMLMRAVFTGRDHGLREGLQSAPRFLFAIIIQVAAAARAVCDDLREWLTGKPTDWRKTIHFYPAE